MFDWNLQGLSPEVQRVELWIQPMQTWGVSMSLDILVLVNWLIHWQDFSVDNGGQNSVE